MITIEQVIEHGLEVSIALPLDVEGLDADRAEHTIAVTPEFGVFRASFTKPPATWNSVHYFYLGGVNQ